MMKFKTYPILIFAMILIAGMVTHATAAVEPKILGFSEWKNQAIRNIYKEYVDDLREVKKPVDEASERKPLQAKADASKKRWERAQKFNIQDYFYLYLNTEFFGNQKALEIAAKSITAAQMAELLVAYQGELNKSPLWNKHKSLSR